MVVASWGSGGRARPLRDEVIGDALHAAWYAVATNRVRTFLTAASVAVGVCSVVFMSSLARSSMISMGSGLEAMGGARLVVVFPKKAEGTRARYARGLTMDDVEALRGRVPHARWISAQTVLGEQALEAGGNKAMAHVLAGDAQVITMLRMKISAGRAFADADDQKGRRVALLALETAVALYSSAAGAVGQTLRVGDELYTVIGVLSRGTRFALEMGYDSKRMVLLLRSATAARKPDQILIGTEAKEHNPAVSAAVTSILSTRHHDADDFRVFDFAVAMEAFRKMLQAFELLAGAIASVALLAGAAGTTNVLMVSVHEQVREIGVRKALGASGGMIVRQFVLQGAIIAALGALAGVAGGLLATFGIGAMVERTHEEWVTVAAVQPMGVAVVCAFVITGVASLFPAWRVKNMTIVESLRARG
jgi:putative ABC transport system permease protein